MSLKLKLSSICLVTYLAFFSHPQLITAQQSTDQVKITAQVPLTDQHIWGIQKNSKISSNLKSSKKIKVGDTLDFELKLIGLKTLPQKSIAVTVQLRDENNNLSAQVIQKSSGLGIVQFSIPVEYSLPKRKYSINFSGTIENTRIDLFSTTLVTIVRPLISRTKSINFNILKTFISHLVNIAKITYSTLFIFATLILIKNAYGFAKKTFVTPAAFSAAARDGPIFICCAC